MTFFFRCAFFYHINKVENCLPLAADISAVGRKRDTGGDLLLSFNLRWSIDSPTRVTATSATAIDNVVANIENMSVSVHNTVISDHDAQLVTIEGVKDTF